jgi:DNA segregation ATPase FtsK/SpoIIIE-like protein
MLPITSDPKRTALQLLAGVAAIAVLLDAFWPLGTLVGAIAGLVAVVRIGTAMQQGMDEQPLEVHDLAAWFEPHPPALPPAPPAEPSPAEARPLPDDVRGRLRDLKAALGDDYPDFARAARLVVETQYASAARLQRELHVPYARARRLLTDLETQHLVGPSTGPVPRQVLMPKDRLPELERMLAA